MSAFVVEDKTINRIVTFLAMDRDVDWMRRDIVRKLGFSIADQAGKEKLGKLMFELNVNAVNQRYGPDEAASFRLLDYKFRTELYGNSIQVFKSLECWLYQCSEGNVPESELYQFMEHIAGQIAKGIVMNLPAYDKLAWA